MSRTTHRAISLLVAAALCGLILLFFANTWPPDLSAIYFAARSYGLGEYDLIYKSLPEFFGGSASPEWQQMAAELGHTDVPTLPYVYAPIWAALLSPIASAVGPIAFYNGVLAVHAAALLGSIWLARRLFSPSTALHAGWWIASGALIIFTSPFFLAFWLNQPHILVTFLILLALNRYQSKQDIRAGVILGIAAALKLSPLVFGLIFLMDRRWAAAMAMAVTGLGLLGLSIATTGIELHFGFLEQLGRAKDNINITPLNFGLEGLIYRTQDIMAGRAGVPAAPLYIKDAQTTVTTVGLLVLAGAISLIWWYRWQQMDAAHVGPVLLSLWAISTLCGPLAWSHYLIGPLLLLLAAALSTPSRFLTKASLVVVTLLLSHPTHLILTAPSNDPIWFMSAGALSLVLMFLVGLNGLRSLKR